MNQRTSFTFYLCCAYILSFGFIDIPELPVIFKKIQLPEIIFSLIGFSFIFEYRNQISLKDLIPPFPYLIFMGALGFTIFFHEKMTALVAKIELALIGYLILVFTIFRKIFIQNLKKNSQKILKIFQFSALILALCGIVGWCLTQFGLDNPMSFSSERYYPYFGKIGRAKGFCPTPALYVNILGSLLLLSLALIKDKIEKWDIFVFTTIGFGILLSFSKSIILIIIGLLVIAKIRKKKPYLPFRNITIFLFIIFNIAIHFMLIHPKNIETEKTLNDNTFISQEPILEIGDYWIVETNYSLLKKSNAIAFYRNPIFGVGLGGHNKFVNQLGDEAAYRADFQGEMADPHSTFFGVFSETGLIGGIGFLVFLFALFIKGQELFSFSNQIFPLISTSLVATFLFFIMEAISTDLLNFRHFWVMLAMFEAIYFLEKKQKQNL